MFRYLRGTVLWLEVRVKRSKGEIRRKEEALARKLRGCLKVVEVEIRFYCDLS